MPIRHTPRLVVPCSSDHLRFQLHRILSETDLEGTSVDLFELDLAGRHFGFPFLKFRLRVLKFRHDSFANNSRLSQICSWEFFFVWFSEMIRHLLND